MSVPEREHESAAARPCRRQSFLVFHAVPPCSCDHVERPETEEESSAQAPRKGLLAVGPPLAPASSLAIRATRPAAPGVPSLARTSASPASTSRRRGVSTI